MSLLFLRVRTNIGSRLLLERVVALALSIAGHYLAWDAAPSIFINVWQNLLADVVVLTVLLLLCMTAIVY